MIRVLIQWLIKFIDCSKFEIYLSGGETNGLELMLKSSTLIVATMRLWCIYVHGTTDHARC